MLPFHTLTNRGQALRLRRMALTALQAYDLEIGRVRLISNDMNGVFRVDMAGGERYVLRVSLPGETGHSLAEIRSEMAWLEALGRDTALGVSRPVPARDGNLVTTAEVEGVPEPRHCALFHWVPGPDLAARLTPANVESLGELTARLHNHAEGFVPPEGFSIPICDSPLPFGDPVVLFDPANERFFPPERRRVFEWAMERVQAAIDGLYAGAEKPRVLHYDLHQWNVKVYRGRLCAIDFEDLMWGYPVQDLAVTLFYLVCDEEGSGLWEALERGYTRCRAWPERYEGEIKTYMAGRQLDLVNFILQDPNPDYRKMVPEYVERAERRLRAFLDK